MPRVEDYNYQHPWATREPHMNPGYTGYLPGYGPKRIYQMAKTYGRMTHDIMALDPMAGKRLAPLMATADDQLKAYQDNTKVLLRELSTNDVKLRKDNISGYAGYVPRKLYYYGKGFVPECREAIAEFYDILKDSPRSDPSLVLPSRSLLPPLPKIPENRPYSLNGHTLESMPKYANFEREKSYGESLLSMGPLNPEKRFIPGYTGYVPGKPFHFGVTYADGSNAGLKEKSFSLEELNVLSERPTLDDWYVGRSMRPSEKVSLDGYHLPMPWKVGPPVGYEGYVPRYAHKVGVRYGESAKTFFNHEDLKNSGQIPSEEKTTIVC